MAIKRNKYITLKYTLILIVLLFLAQLPLIAQYNEDLIKAAYIERITRFVEWPAKDSFQSEQQFVIGVYDEDEFFLTLTAVFKEKSIKELKVKVITVDNPKQINGCNLCYISKNAKSRIKEFIDIANSSGVLLISGSTGFCKSGVHINFYLEDEKLKFEINELSLASAGFRVSYLLKQNTRIIR
jgi:hypothetical protein